MAYIQPNSVIQLFQGINLDNRYLHTIYFANEQAQNTWFTSKIFKTYQQQSYTRYTRNQLKLKDDATTLLGCTYMRFKNDRAVDKWFYAFVTGCDYVNENTVLITYEIDVMQTWFMQGGSVAPCMVLREHVNDDTFGLHLEEEPIGSEVYECESVPYTSDDGDLFADYSLIVNTTEKPDNDKVLNNHLANGTKFYAIDTENQAGFENSFNALISLILGSWNSGFQKIEVIDMFTFPSKFSSMDANNNSHTIRILHPDTMHGYTPKNKKLYTYPFSFLQGTTRNGSTCTYRWEYFASILADIPFRCYGNPIGGGQIHCYPTYYNGIVNNIDASMVMDDFPKNPFVYDAYQAWVAGGGKARLEREEAFTNVRGVSALVSGASTAMMQGTTGMSMFGSNALNLGDTNTATMTDLSGMTRGANRLTQGITGYVDTVVNVAEAKNKIAYQWADARYRPNVVVGTATPNLVVATKNLNFLFFNVHVKSEELPKIDEFFSCFGYAVNRVKAPNLTGRRYFNFVQTDKAVINGNMPASSKEAIGRIFDGGITFWHNGDHVGDYSQATSQGTIDNPIIA